MSTSTPTTGHGRDERPRPVTDPGGRGRVRPLGDRGRAALAAAAAGHSVFPVKAGSKHPAIKNWEKVATRDPSAIAEWWRRHPACNLGIATGPSGLVVIDLDDGHGEAAPEPWTGARGGHDVLAMLARQAGEPGPWGTYTVVTPTGGRHLYFRAPEGRELRNTQGRLGWHIDSRAAGGFVVAATSRRDVGTYRAVNRAPIAPLPDWLAEALAPPEPEPITAPLPQAPARGAHHAYIEAAVRGEGERIAHAEPGTRHQARLKAALKLGNRVGRGELDRAEARARLLAAAERHIGADPRQGHDPTTRYEVERDIDDGLDYGARNVPLLGDTEARHGHRIQEPEPGD